MRKILAFFAVSILFTFNSNAQELIETLNTLSGNAAKEYVNPVVSAFGSNLNTGWVTSVPKNEFFGVNVEVRFVGQGSFFPENAKEFSTNGKVRLTLDQANYLLNNSNIPEGSERDQLLNLMLQDEFTLNISGPTIAGDKTKEVFVSFPTTTYSGLPTIQGKSVGTGAMGFLDDIPLLPQAAIQLNVGTLYGTEVAVRFLPSVELNDIGKFSFYGVGIIHNPASFLPAEMIPVDLGVGLFYQKMKVGDVFETTALQFGLYASKHFGLPFLGIAPYAGVTVESSTTTLQYDYIYTGVVSGHMVDVKKRMSFDLDARNSAALTLGAKFNIGFFNLFADYKVASTSTVNGGISFTF